MKLIRLKESKLRFYEDNTLCKLLYERNSLYELDGMDAKY